MSSKLEVIKTEKKSLKEDDINKKIAFFINDKIIDEPFEKVESNDNFAPFIIPKGEYFVLGDNRPNSFDSRLWKYKTVKRTDIIGVVSNIIRKEDYENGKRW